MNGSGELFFRTLAALDDRAECVEWVCSNQQEIEIGLKSLLKDLRESDTSIYSNSMLRKALTHLTQVNAFVSFPASHILVDVLVEVAVGNPKNDAALSWALGGLQRLLQRVPAEEKDDEDVFMAALGFQQADLNKQLADDSFDALTEAVGLAARDPDSETLREISNHAAPLLRSERGAQIAGLMLSAVGSGEQDAAFVTILADIQDLPQPLRFRLWLSHKHVLLEELSEAITQILHRPYLPDSEIEERLGPFAHFVAQNPIAFHEILAVLRHLLCETRSYAIARLMHLWNRILIQRSKQLDVLYIEFFEYSLRGFVALLSNALKQASSLHSIVLHLRETTRQSLDIYSLQYLWSICYLFPEWVSTALSLALAPAASQDTQHDAAEYVAWLIEPRDSQIRAHAAAQFSELLFHIRNVRSGTVRLSHLETLYAAHPILQRFCVLELLILCSSNDLGSTQAIVQQLLQRSQVSAATVALLLRQVEKLVEESAKARGNAALAAMCESFRQWFSSDSQRRGASDALRRLDRWLELCRITVIELD